MGTLTCVDWRPEVQRYKSDRIEIDSAEKHDHCERVKLLRSRITLNVGVLRPEFVHVTTLRSLTYPVDFEVRRNFR